MLMIIYYCTAEKLQYDQNNNQVDYVVKHAVFSVKQSGYAFHDKLLSTNCYFSLNLLPRGYKLTVSFVAEYTTAQELQNNENNNQVDDSFETVVAVEAAGNAS
ncbi:MAG: hypothetical protein ACOYI2_09125 [Bacillota bacterium]|jgi:TctA family transporter|nr:hypothetical protein [Clostridia bacterium]